MTRECKYLTYSFEIEPVAIFNKNYRLFIIITRIISIFSIMFKFGYM